MAFAACSKTSGTGCPELDAFEKLHDGEHFNDVYVAKCGIYFARKQLVAPGELATPHPLAAAFAHAQRPPELVVFDIDDQPIAVATWILRAVSGATMNVARRTHDEASHVGYEGFTVNASDRPTTGKVRLSVDVLPERVWVGLAGVEEYQEILNKGDDVDWEKLEMVLKEHKASAFFADRTAAELAVDPALRSRTLLHAVQVMSYTGFIDVALLPRDKLSAKAYLAPVVDVLGLQTAGDIAKKLGELAGADPIDLRAGSVRVCGDLTIAKPSGKRATAHHVALLRKNGTVTVAYAFTPDPKDKDPGYTSGRHETTSREDMRGNVNNDRIGNPVKNAPLEIAMEDGVTAAALLDALGAACDVPVTAVELRAPSELSIDPAKMPAR